MLHLDGLRAGLPAVGVTRHSDPSGAACVAAVHRLDDVLAEHHDGRGVLRLVDLLEADVEHLVARRRRDLLVGVDDPALAEVLLVLVAQVAGQDVELALTLPSESL